MAVSYMHDFEWDKKLNINTEGRDATLEDSHHYPYEPTPYSVLERLAESGYIKKENILIDYGCGKGRLLFYINHFFNSKVTGIEMNKNFYNDCLINKKSYLTKHRNISHNIEFINDFAENYIVDENDNKFYFFNPFSVQIFMKIIDNILESLEKNTRPVEIILYYPSDDYIYYLETCTAFELIGEVKIDELYSKNSRERFLVYRLIY